MPLSKTGAWPPRAPAHQENILVFDLAKFYTGTVKSKNSGDFLATLNISRIMSDQDSIVFEYSFTANINEELYDFEGKGKVLSDRQIVEFSGVNNCKLKIKEGKIILESIKDSNTDYWMFEETKK